MSEPGDMSSTTAEIKKRYPQAIEPHYPMPEINDPIDLVVGRIELQSEGDKKIEVEGRIRWVWNRSPQAVLEGTAATNSSVSALTSIFWKNEGRNEGRNWPLKFTGSGLGLDFGISRLAGAYIRGHARNGSSTVPEFSLSEFRFHIPNFVSYLGQPTWSEAGEVIRCHRSRLEFRWEDWSIAIDSVPKAGDRIKRLSWEGGYQWTHCGILQHKKGRFTPGSARAVRKGLAQYCAFLRSQWCGPVLWVGFDPHGRKTWVDTEGYRARPVPDGHTWFPRLDIESVQEVEQSFPRFMDRVIDSVWSDPFQLALSWTGEASTRGITLESRLVAIHTALEMLSWAYLHEDGRTAMPNPGEFKKLGSAGKIRKLLTELGIPTAFPCPLSSGLTKACDVLEAEPEDGPAVITKIRHAVVHSKRSKREQLDRLTPDALNQSFRLGQTYLDLVLLRLIGYQGLYTPRWETGWVGDIEVPVPWQQK